MQELTTRKATFDFAPVDCPICNLMLEDLNDSIQYLETGCCGNCWVSFLEPLRKLKQDDDYEPTKKEMKEWNKKLAKCDN